MSTTYQSFGTSPTGTTWRCERGWTWAATTTSVGSMRRTRLRRASAMIRVAFSSWSGSTRLLPSAAPRAARKVLAMPPPTRTAWQRASSDSSTSSLPDTFAPPMTVWNGFGGLASRRDSELTSRSISRPATAGR